MAEEKKNEAQSTEYPKSLYAGGERNGAHRIVHGDEDEVAARAEGFKMIDKAADKASVERLAAPAPKSDDKPKKAK